MSLELRGITKRFGALTANDAIDLAVADGEIHAILGENGAGKSTLMSILYGFYEADRGTIKVHGRNVHIRSPKEAIAVGIGMVHQHFMLVDPLSVIDNVMLGAEGGVLLEKGERHIRAELEKLGRDYGLVIDPDAIVGALPVGLQQRVEILKALIRGAEILILDEPTRGIDLGAKAEIYELLRTLANDGLSILAVSSELVEIFEISQRVLVMHAGLITADLTREEATEQRVVAAATGEGNG